ncbi:hypothetical protein MMPV_003237 [Pyropia vietnamensis]
MAIKTTAEATGPAGHPADATATAAGPATGSTGLAPLELATLDAVDAAAPEPQSSTDLAAAVGVSHAVLVDGVLKTLAAREALVLTPVLHEAWVLTAEGTTYASTGSPEAQLVTHLAAATAAGGSGGGNDGGDGGGSGCSLADVDAALGAGMRKIGMQQAMRQGWVVLHQPTKTLRLSAEAAASPPPDHVAAALCAVRDAAAGSSSDDGGAAARPDEGVLKALAKRKLVVKKATKTFTIVGGPRLADARRPQATDLGRDALVSGAWRSLAFKPYNFAAAGKPVDGGHLHTLLKVREQFRLIFLEMGFAEMDSARYVESSFWNFDALFQPQQHPARDEHDTFFLSSPELSRLPDEEDYVARVKAAHCGGPDGAAVTGGSRGYRYAWSAAEARKNILRTHTTAVSCRMLRELATATAAAGGVFTPAKMFSIDRVFRNETLDATHLAEFHQIEGLVADRGLSLGHLKGVIHTFFRKMGMDRLRFKPTHNPYTEPSLEVHAFHQGLGKWVEVGNSGMFRPEMLLPMGLPPDVRVIAWGLSLERPTMIKYGVSNIRDLFGHKMDLDAIQRNPICRITF